MRRTISGAARRLAMDRPGGSLPARPETEIATAERPRERALARVSVVQIRAGAAVPRDAHGDVALLDARAARPSVVYRSIVRLRSGGWEGGIVMLIDPSDLAMVPVASSIGVADFVLSTAGRDETDVRLRRAAGWKPAQAAAPDAGKPGIHLHWRTHQMSFEGRTISLTLREMQLLSTLMERGGDVVTADDLSRVAWGKTRAGSDLAPAYVCSLRKKLAWFGARFGIQTVRGVGYRFVF